MKKTILILIISIFTLNGCNAFLPSISVKSNAMLNESSWQPINADEQGINAEK